MAVIRVDNLQFNYEDGTQALTDVGLDIAEGAFAFLLGRNGSGKTTLLHHLNRLLDPAGGTVYYRGRPVSSLSSQEVYRSIGLVFQDPNDQLFGATVGDDVAFGPRNLGLAREEVEARVTEALGMVNLLHLRQRPVHNLSFGQKRRLAIAGILAMRPDVMLLDEPTAGLDPEGCEQLMGFLARLNAEGLTLIMATHDVDLAAEYASRVYVLDQGRLALEGAPAAVLQQIPELEAMGLRPPRLTRLFALLDQEDGLASPPYPVTLPEARTRVLRLAGGRPEPVGAGESAVPIQVVGLGPGSLDYLPPVARRAVERAEVLVGGKRALAMFPGVAPERKEIAGDLEEVVRFIEKRAGKRVVVLVSGDPGLYSFLDFLLRHVHRERIEVIPGVSSVQLAFARARLPWHDARVITLHGRGREGLIEAVRDHAKVAILTDQRFPPDAVAGYLIEMGIRNKRVTVADNLSYPAERVVAGSLADIARTSGFSNAVVVIEDES